MKTFIVSGAFGEAPACDYMGDGPLFIFAHGAGAGQSHAFMTTHAEALTQRGLRVVTFDFPYMAAERRAPDRPAVLEASFTAVIAAAVARARVASLVIGGKSMGGRIASHLAARDTSGVRGLVVLGYPLQAPSGAMRSEHLPRLGVPSLFLQGERDSFGGPEALRPHLPESAHLVPVLGADHGFDVRKKDGRTKEDVAQQLDDAIADFVHSNAK